MSRLRHFISGVASSYIVLAATALYSFAAVPLALHYLGKEQFGLWALMLQLAGYLQLIDFGVSSSLPRLLIEYKDNRQSDAYGSMLLTGWLVLLVPALGLLGGGMLLASSAANAMAIPANLRCLFTELFRWQCALAAVGFATRIFGTVLIVHQRIDFYNYSQLLLLVVNFPILWIGLAKHNGVFSFIWAQSAGTLACTAGTVLACLRLDLLPTRGHWGRPSWGNFHPVFHYGKDLFLVALGTQLIIASQTVIVARFLSLEASGIWTAGSRVFQLVCQVVWRVSDVCGAAFAEMIVRDETQVLQTRYRELIVLTASLAVYAAVALALCNAPFVSLWTGGKFVWPALNDVLFGMWLVLLAIGHCHNGFVLLTKRVGFMRYVFFLEGALSVLLASIVVRKGGIPAMITVSITSMLTLDFAYGVWRTARYFKISIFEITVVWMTPAIRFLLVYLPLAGLCFLLTRPLSSGAQLITGLIFCLTGGLVLFLRLGLPHSLQAEIAHRVPARLTRIMHRFFALPFPQRSNVSEYPQIHS